MKYTVISRMERIIISVIHLSSPMEKSAAIFAFGMTGPNSAEN